ncbi:hypothetical protein KUTeg_005509 [Tegillarca granosa]|uniref:Cytochrome P450 n=1 Tax=Tegillarca granosa TaxID=220873 RepID=A0ABQ9FMW9_TEGGR|nr:hypothetical protein KUTeg_005509 [Tegillarca granosa]
MLEFIRLKKQQKLKGENDKGKYQNLPPGTMGIPILGETISFLIHKAEFFRQKRKNYGPVFKTHLFGKPTIRVSGRENIRKIIFGENRIVQSSYPASVKMLVGTNSLSMSTGTQHRDRKRQLMKFLSVEFLEMHVMCFSELVQETLRYWSSQSSVEIYAECRYLFMELAAKFLVSVDLSKNEKKVMKKHYQDFSDNLFTLPINLPGFGFNKALNAKRTLKKMFKTIVKNGEKSVNQFPSVLEAYGATLEDQKDIDDEFLDAIVELLWNSSETISSAAFSIVYLLATHPVVMTKLKLELSENGYILEDLNNNVSDTKQTSFKGVQELPYTEAVVKETLRLMPPIGGAYRKVLETFEIEGYTIPKEWTVVFGIRETHEHDENLLDPMNFNPDRWIGNNDASKIGYFPFGGGARGCPGKNFANTVLRIFTVELCRNLNWDLLEQNPELLYFPTPRPKNNLHVRFYDKSAIF